MLLIRRLDLTEGTRLFGLMFVDIMPWTDKTAVWTGDGSHVGTSDWDEDLILFLV